MLISLVVMLQPTAPAMVPAALGPACQAWFLDRVRAVDPALAQALHDGSRRRPYTVSSLRGGKPGPRGRLALSSGRSLWIRVTSLEGRLSAVMLDEIMPRLPDRITLGGAELAVTGATTDAGEHPWAGQSSYAALLERYLLDRELPRRVVGLHFASPTTFRRTGGTLAGRRVRDHDWLWPRPDLVFGGLADAWQSFSPIPLKRNVRAFAACCLAPRRFRLATRLVDDGRSRQAGVVGSCEYRLLSGDALWVRLVHLLAAFSFFCGVGRGTTAGWGQAKLVNW